MSPLLRKELRALLPQLVLLMTVFGAELLYAPFLERLDSRSWAHSAGVEPGHATSLGITIIGLSLLVAWSLFPREHDERTIELLYSLPVSRPSIYLAKVLAGALVLVASFTVGALVAWALQLPNPQSFSGHQFRLDVAATGLALQTALALVALVHGVVLSFLRRFGLIVYGLGAWTLILLQRLDPALAILDPTVLVEMEYDGRRLLVPWAALALHGGVSLAGLGLGYLLWMGPAERVWIGMTRALDRPLGRAALGCGGLTLGGLALGLMIYLGARDDEGERPPVRWASFQTARVDTLHYSFTYPIEGRGLALPLIEAADPAYEAVRRALGARVGDPIVVDLTERSEEHAGLTSWQKIRMDLLSEEDERRLLHTFLHESTHALSLQESARKMSDNGRACRFFAEGLAEWVAHRLTDQPERLRASRRHALAACSRQELPFAVLADDRALHQRHDPHLVYPVGETWVEALARCYGEDAPGRVLRAMARPEAPRGLDPLPFWQDTLRAAGCDLEQVTWAWFELLERLEEEEAEFLAACPRLSGGLVGVEDRTLVFRAQLDRPPPRGTRVLVRVRESPETPDHELLGAEGRADAQDPTRFELRLPRDQVQGRRFDLQLGVLLPGMSLPLCEPWQAAIAPQ